MGDKEYENFRDDIKDLYKKHGDLVENLNNLVVSFTRLDGTLNNLFIPKQPCKEYKALKKEFDKHLDDHKDKTESKINRWRQPAINAVYDIVKFIAIGGLSYAAGKLL